MAAGTEFSPYAMLETGFNRDTSMSTGEDVTSDHLKQMVVRKPPRHISGGVRHSMSTATLQSPHTQV